MDASDNAKKYLTTLEAAHYLSLAQGTLAVWRLQGKGPPYVKFRSRVRYLLSDLDAWLDAQTVRPGDTGHGKQGGAPVGGSRDATIHHH